jgi:transcriptional antiterminator RfaH
MVEAWYVIHTKPRKEGLVSAYLKSQSFEVYFPILRVKPVNPRASKIRPYFPRYIFVKSDIEKVGVSALHWVPNAIGIVKFGDELSSVPDEVINKLKQCVKDIQHAGGLNLAGLKQGDLIRITHGPLAGYEAIFDMRLSASDRVQVLLKMLGRQVKVQVDSNTVAKKSTG